MKRLNNKGFTLVELIAVVVLLSVITAIGVNSMNDVIIQSKEENYDLLIENIRGAVETFYQECKYDPTPSNSELCDVDIYGNPKTEITLGELVKGGFITDNSIGGGSIEVKCPSGVDWCEKVLFNPIDNEDISCCKIKYDYDSGKFDIEPDGVVGTCSEVGFCPTSY